MRLLPEAIITAVIARNLPPKVGFRSRLLERDWRLYAVDVKAPRSPGVRAGAVIIGGDMILAG